MTLPDLTQLTLLAIESACTGDTVTLRHALDAGVPVDATTPLDRSLLGLACDHGHVEAARMLLAHGANPDTRDAEGQTPLVVAAVKGRLDLAAALVHAGANVNAPAVDGRTALMRAAASNRVESVRWLLAHGADPALRDAAGARAVDIATGAGAADVVSLLIG